MKLLVTGGAGFIGSHLVDRLLQLGHSVTVVDNLSQGSLENTSTFARHEAYRFIRGDVTDETVIGEASRGCEAVFHVAANPEVRMGDPNVHFRENILATFRVLEAAIGAGMRQFLFTSSSTVYGDATRLPTPEDYAPLEPISVYGACKLSSESLIAAYCHIYKIRGLVFRLANIVGSRAKQGVVVDFVRKLADNPKRLEVLGDGTQTKSYLLVEDCVDAMVHAFEKSEGLYDAYNVAARDAIDVRTLARIVIDERKLENVEIVCMGGPEGGGGWIGDVKKMWLDVSKLSKLGWRPQHNSSESVRKAVAALR